MRLAVASGLLIVILAGDFLKAGFGTICSFGIGWLSITCPLGFAQLALAARDPLLQMWPSVALGAVTTVLAGRYFCAWVCPTVLVQSRFSRAAQSASRSLARLNPIALVIRGKLSVANTTSVGAQHRSLTRYGVLGGALASSFVFGFPVFCAVCPVGLFFGAIFAAKRLFLGQEPGWELLIFPVLIAVEVLFAKSWCRSLCPLGALLGLLSPLHRILRPSVDDSRCLRSRGTACRVCEHACPQQVAVALEPAGVASRECTKCLSCYEKCPARAVELGRR